MLLRTLSRCSALGALLLCVAPAGGGTITILDVDGAFSGALPSGCCTIHNGSGLSTIRWGIDIGDGRSGYDFQAKIPPQVTLTVPPSPSGWIPLAEFAHLNRGVLTDPLTLLSSVDLYVTLLIDIDGVAHTRTFRYGLTHDETSNDEPCPAFQKSAIPCDDRVLVGAPTAGTILVGSTLYTLQLAFSDDGGFTTLNSFISREGSDNRSGVYGRFTADLGSLEPEPGAVIPEPTSMALVGGGLAALGLRGRRRKQC